MLKRYLGAALLASGLALSLPALAQDTTTVVTPDNTTVVTDTSDPTYVAPAVYPTTGWDPGALLALSGGLGAGSIMLKGALRRRSSL